MEILTKTCRQIENALVGHVIVMCLGDPDINLINNRDKAVETNI
jgi:hypothetical protein